MAEKPSKKWLQSMQDYFNAFGDRAWDVNVNDWHRALKELGYGVTPSGAVIKWGKDAQRIYKKRFNISDAKESVRKSQRIGYR